MDRPLGAKRPPTYARNAWDKLRHEIPIPQPTSSSHLLIFIGRPWTPLSFYFFLSKTIFFTEENLHGRRGHPGGWSSGQCFLFRAPCRDIKVAGGEMIGSSEGYSGRPKADVWPGTAQHPRLVGSLVSSWIASLRHFKGRKSQDLSLLSHSHFDRYVLPSSEASKRTQSKHGRRLFWVRHRRR